MLLPLVILTSDNIPILYVDAHRAISPVELFIENVDGVISIDASIPIPSVAINILLASPEVSKLIAAPPLAEPIRVLVPIIILLVPEVLPFANTSANVLPILEVNSKGTVLVPIHNFSSGIL